MVRRRHLFAIAVAGSIILALQPCRVVALPDTSLVATADPGGEPSASTAAPRPIATAGRLYTASRPAILIPRAWSSRITTPLNVATVRDCHAKLGIPRTSKCLFDYHSCVVDLPVVGVVLAVRECSVDNIRAEPPG